MSRRPFALASPRPLLEPGLATLKMRQPPCCDMRGRCALETMCADYAPTVCQE